MTTIDPASRLLAQIRAQAREWKRRVASGREGSAGETSLAPTAGETPAHWMAQVARSVVAIAPTDPDRRRKAFRVYLQATLARECGIEHFDDPAFQDLVARVQDAMEADPRLRRAIESAGDMLLESAAG